MSASIGIKGKMKRDEIIKAIDQACRGTFGMNGFEIFDLGMKFGKGVFR